MERPVVLQWIYQHPQGVTLKTIRRAIIDANKTPPHSYANKIAWKNVYALSKQFRLQEQHELMFVDDEDKPPVVTAFLPTWLP